jgi:hypothetical protein
LLKTVPSVRIAPLAAAAQPVQHPGRLQLDEPARDALADAGHARNRVLARVEAAADVIGPN